MTTSPYTTASHASAFTGCFPAQHRVRDYFKSPMHRPTVFQILKERGFTTRFAIDYPLILGEHLGFRRGIDDYRVEDQLGALHEFARSSEPEILFTHFADAHFPYGTHVIRDWSAALEAFLASEARALGLELSQGPAAPSLEAVRSPDEARLEWHYREVLAARYDRGDYERLLQWYAQGLARFDAGRFEEFLRALRGSGLLQRADTIVVLFGDHGEDWSPSCWAHFNSCDWSVMNVPLLVYRAGTQPEARGDLVRTVDIAPTVLEATGIEHDALPAFDGRSLTAQRGGRIGFAECWLSDTSALHNYIRGAQSGAEQGELSSYLAKDAAFSDEAELQRWFDESGRQVGEVLTSRGEPTAHHEAGEPLRTELKGYRFASDRPGQDADEVELREALRRLGYFRQGRA